MIGLAISMGSHALLLPCPGDGAIAAEPTAGKTATDTLQPLTVAGSSVAGANVQPVNGQSVVEPSTIEHAVQEGQTLSQLGRLYQVDAATVARFNGLAVDAVLRVGQVLRVPTSSQTVRLAQVDASIASVTIEVEPESSGSGANVASQEANRADGLLKAEQDSALNRLQQKRQRLKQGLAQAKVAKLESEAIVSPKLQDRIVPTVMEPVKLDQPQVEQPKVDVQQPALVGQVSQPQAAKQVAVVTVPTQPEVVSAPVVSSPTYRVAAGDTLSAIARLHGISQQQLIEANRLRNPDLIQANQVLVIPEQKSAPILDSVPASLNALTQVEAVSTTEVPVIGLEPASQAGSLPTSQVEPKLSPSTAVAAVPTLRRIPVTRPSVVTQEHDHVENLRLEIVRLREKYRVAASNSSGTTPTPVKVAASLRTSSQSSSQPASRLVNPDAGANLGRSQSQVQPPAASKLKPQVMAAAPLGSESYAPLIPSPVGQMVSPELPPLGSGDRYLPENAPKSSGYIWPAKGMLSSGYGWRWGRMHKGIDIAAPTGTPIVAAAAGIVTYAGWNAGGYGNLVEITHPDGSETLYAHNNRILVKEGQPVEQGQQIAEMGSTGYSTGPHSHFEIHVPGQGAVNPIAYLQRPKA
jgi:murein DD-endopeptidase MepM/ murein hydrolase activator NlpD